MPAMVVNDDAGNQTKRGVLTFFAGKPAPTEDEKRIHDAKRVALALAFDLRRRKGGTNISRYRSNGYVLRKDLTSSDTDSYPTPPLPPA